MRISLDHAEALANAAAEAGLASWEGDGDDRLLQLSPVLRAKLAELGAKSLLELDTAQAVAVAVFIGQEAG